MRIAFGAGGVMYLRTRDKKGVLLYFSFSMGSGRVGPTFSVLKTSLFEMFKPLS
jgi:hypothetical protein